MPGKKDIERAESRPVTLAVNPEGIPAALKEEPRWVCWRWQRRQDKKGVSKWTKPLIDPSCGRLAKSTDAATWGTFQAAETWRQSHPQAIAGIGFVLGDGFAGVDLDDVRDAATGSVQPWALEAVRVLDSYAEISPSGTGIKVLILAKSPGNRRKFSHVEIYDGERYFTITGQRLEGCPATVNERQAQLTAFYRQVFQERPAARGPSAAGTSSLTDADLLERARAASNGAKFRRLFDQGDASGYPSASEADLALCDLLAFWTGPDPDRISALFQRSGLMRPKWDEQHHADGTTYGKGTVALALAGRTEFWRGGAGNGHTRNGDGKPVATEPGQTGYDLILAHFQARYQGIFRRGPALWSSRLGREVRMVEACAGAGKDLIGRLATATDAPRNETGAVKRHALPQFFGSWCKSAWVDMLDSLPDEENTVEVSDLAHDQFAAQLAGALHTIVALGHSHQRGKGSETVDVQRRSLIDWCGLWARTGHRWGRIRSYQLWACRSPMEPESQGRLRVALRVELFCQIGHPELGLFTQNKFGRLAGLYGLTTGEGNLRVQGYRAVELAPAFVEALLSKPDSAE